MWAGRPTARPTDVHNKICCVTPAMPALTKGSTAPDFEALAHSGEKVSLASLTAETPCVLLWFYPRASTGG